MCAKLFSDESIAARYASASQKEAMKTDFIAAPYTFAIIAPYGNMAALAKKLAADMPCALLVRDTVALDEAAAIAKKVSEESAPDVILSRGGTAEYIRAVVDVPVVSVSTTALDLLRTLLPFAGQVKRIAFFNYKEPMLGVDMVGKTLGIVIDEYLFHTRDDMISDMVRAKAEGAELGVGGVLISQMRELCGLPGILLEAGEDAVLRSLREAFSIAQVRRDAQQRQARLRTILNTIAEGILVTDEKNILTLMNPSAERLLSLKASEALGKPAQAVVPNTQTRRVLESGQPELGEVQEMGGNTVVTSRVPIIVNGQAVGVVCTFAEAGRIQQAEQRLRGKMRAKGFYARYRLDDIVTQNPAMHALKELARLYAGTDATVLLQGESGTGKELFAQGIHQASPRRHGPFVAVNCAAIPESLLESELFGYEEGAFTGARRQGKAGLFEVAHQGTLFLDEVSELPRSLQARLLRVLQEREIVRVGGAQVVPVDIRIICATNRDLAAWTQAGQFREDLYYRLNVLLLAIPPLRERPEDILYLALCFLQLSLPAAKQESQLRKALGKKFLAHSWPGNVRELASTMERLALVMTMLPDTPWEALLEQVWQHHRSAAACLDKGAAATAALQVPLQGSLKSMTRTLERNAIRRLLAEHGNDQGKVAKMLEISRMSLWRKLQADPGSE